MIVLLTDFGLRDAYVGLLKGVIHTIHSAAQIVDLTHEVGRHAIREGAMLLADAVPYFPAGAVFLAVVDPGVGGARRALAAAAGGYWFVGPDNGLLDPVLDKLGGAEVVELAEPRFQLAQVSGTFHGRDIFAPAAAYLALGTPLSAFGPPVLDRVRLPALRLERVGRMLRGEIVRIDHFGNLETSIGPLVWRAGAALELTLPEGRLSLPAASFCVTLPQTELAHPAGVHRTYGAVEAGQLLALVSSAGYLEVSCNGASAAERTGARVGGLVELSWE